MFDANKRIFPCLNDALERYKKRGKKFVDRRILKKNELI